MRRRLRAVVLAFLAVPLTCSATLFVRSFYISDTVVWATVDNGIASLRASQGRLLLSFTAWESPGYPHLTRFGLYYYSSPPLESDIKELGDWWLASPPVQSGPNLPLAQEFITVQQLNRLGFIVEATRVRKTNQVSVRRILVPIWCIAVITVTVPLIYIALGRSKGGRLKVEDQCATKISRM